jgi:hypothetical protein
VAVCAGCRLSAALIHLQPMTLDAAIWGAELAAEQYDIDGILNLQLHEITSHNRLSIEMQRRFLSYLIDVDAKQ